MKTWHWVGGVRSRLKSATHVHPAGPVSCPRCAGQRCPVYASRLPITRYHRCLACGQRFKSVEKHVRGEPLLKGDL